MVARAFHLLYSPRTRRNGRTVRHLTAHLPSSVRRPAALAVAAVILGAPLSGGGSQATANWPPPTLQATGLYADWASKQVAPENLPFSPQYPLWTDGAKKSRWMYLPEGQFIDASNPDVWQFPVGTRLWKEFRFERRAETRFIEHTAEGWQFAAYAWNEDESEAPLAPELGVRQSVPIRDGIRHAIPSRSDCRVCHEAGPRRVLGVTALQLSPDRDPNALHGEPLPASAVDLAMLVERGLVRGLPFDVTRTPPRIAAATPTGRTALGYLSGNCGGCHTGRGELASLAFALDYPLGRSADEPPPAIGTTVGRPSHFQIPDEPEAIERVRVGHPDTSVLVGRMASRNPLVQMPPLGTRIVDEEALALIRRWITEDLSSGLPADVDRAEP